MLMFSMDPEVTKYFRKILRSLFAFLMWLFINVISGIYFKLAYSENYSFSFTYFCLAGYKPCLFTLVFV
jgi:hypothetical protein